MTIGSKVYIFRINVFIFLFCMCVQAVLRRLAINRLKPTKATVLPDPDVVPFQLGLHEVP